MTSLTAKTAYTSAVRSGYRPEMISPCVQAAYRIPMSGYVVNDKYVNISVDTDTAFETDGDTNDAIITVEYSDAPAVGELTVEKKESNDIPTFFHGNCQPESLLAIILHPVASRIFITFRDGRNVPQT